MSLRDIFSKFIHDSRDQLPHSIARNKKKLTVWLVIIVLVLVVGGSGMYKFMNSPTFCGSCHNMDPYKISWANSKHKDVGCTECHLPPGFFNHLKYKAIDGMLSGVYFVTGKSPTKPRAHVVDGACTQCHGPEKLKEPIDFKLGIKFDHTTHFDVQKFQCITCHEASRSDTPGHFTIEPSVCVRCHFFGDGGNKCTSCHKDIGKIKFAGKDMEHKAIASKVVVTGGTASDCEACHGNTIEKNLNKPKFQCIVCHQEAEKVDKAATITSKEAHEIHITKHKAECYGCHGIVSHGKPVPATLKGFKHTDHVGDVSCENCHKSGETPTTIAAKIKEVQGANPVCKDCH